MSKRSHVAGRAHVWLPTHPPCLSPAPEPPVLTWAVPEAAALEGVEGAAAGEALRLLEPAVVDVGRARVAALQGVPAHTCNKQTLRNCHNVGY